MSKEQKDKVFCCLREKTIDDCKRFQTLHCNINRICQDCIEYYQNLMCLVDINIF